MQARVDEFAPFQDISPDQIYISNDDKWKMFFLKAGKIRFERNCLEFPETLKILDSDKNFVSAYFSVIHANKMLMPLGPWWSLRMHLGIKIPTDGKDESMADKKEYRWKRVRLLSLMTPMSILLLTFRATIEVLFLDHMRLPVPLSWINHFVVYIIGFFRISKRRSNGTRSGKNGFMARQPDGFLAKQRPVL